MTDNLKIQLRRDENEVLHAYPDTLGYITIGIGRMIDERKHGGISREESTFLFDNDILAKTTALKVRLPWFDQLDPVRQGVLLNMSFQLGVDGVLAFNRTLGMIQRGDYVGAAREMLLSAWSQQTPERAHRLSEQMRTGVWQ
jgi:lysozyme